jgi:hypothetical protein
MPLSTWTTRDELLSDALHLMDVAKGLDRPLSMDLPDYEPRSAVEEAMEQRLRTASWGVVDAYREEVKLNAKPALTSDDRPSASDATDNSPLIQSKVVDGQAAQLAVEMQQAADAALLVEPRSIETDLIVEPPREVGGTEPTTTDEPEWTVPSIASMTRYAATAVSGRNLTPIRVRIAGVGEWSATTIMMRPSVQAQISRRRRKQQRRLTRNLLPLRGQALRSTHDLTSHGCADLALTARRDRLVTDYPLPLPSAFGRSEFAVVAYGIVAAARKTGVLDGSYRIGCKAAADHRAYAALRGRIDRFDALAADCAEAALTGHQLLSDEHFQLGQELAVEAINYLAA